LGFPTGWSFTRHQVPFSKFELLKCLQILFKLLKMVGTNCSRVVRLIAMIFLWSLVHTLFPNKMVVLNLDYALFETLKFWHQLATTLCFIKPLARTWFFVFLFDFWRSYSTRVSNNGIM
jgi:hypothetical protein